MDPSTTQLIVASIVAVGLWRIFRSLSNRSLSQIPGPPSESWWKGNFGRFFSANGWAFHEELYREYGGAARLDMMFGDQQLYVTDPLALEHICVKEQYIYEETKRFRIMNGITLGPSLMNTIGDDHKRQRKLLNPVFSIKNMRELVPIFYSIGYKLRDTLEKEVAKGKEYIDVMSWVSRASLECIGQGTLGYSFNALDEQSTNAYSDTLKHFGPSLYKFQPLIQFLPFINKLGSPSFRRWLLDLLPSKFKAVKELMAIIDSFERHSKNILQEKRRALADGDEAVHAQIGSGKDMMSVLLKANSVNGATHLPESELLAHMSTFVVTGHETTASAISRLLHVLSEHQEVQSKLREEVTEARKEQGDLDYDALMALPLLDAICRETLRLFPPLLSIDRTAREDTVLPLLWPIKSADRKTEISEIPIKKNTNVFIGILGANRSKAIWGEDADEWKPERWLNPMPKSVEEAHLPGVYSQMMTFLAGGRACIGLKFSETEMKLVLSMLIERFIFEPGPRIFWEMGGLHHPVMEGDTSGLASVPLKVSMVGK